MATLREDVAAIKAAHEDLDKRLREVENKLGVLVFAVFGGGSLIVTLLLYVINKHLV